MLLFCYHVQFSHRWNSENITGLPALYKPLSNTGMSYFNNTINTNWKFCLNWNKTFNDKGEVIHHKTLKMYFSFLTEIQVKPLDSWHLSYNQLKRNNWLFKFIFTYTIRASVQTATLWLQRLTASFTKMIRKYAITTDANSITVSPRCIPSFYTTIIRHGSASHHDGLNLTVAGDA